jgi:hypothetical protein
MELQEYLRKHGLEQLVETYQIGATPHQQYPNLICLKYSMIESPMSEVVVRQSRGIVFDQDNNWEIVSYPYDKFFNYGEGRAAVIDWMSARVYEKLDGSLMTLYFYAEKWHISSSGMADAAGKIHNCDLNLNLGELFWQVWSELNYQLPIDTENCYIFELMTKFNCPIVIPQQNSLTLHGVRNIKTLAESDPQIWADKYGWAIVKAYNHLTNDTEVKAAANLLNPIDSEGFVICDRHFNRVKVKSPQYVAIAHLMGGFSAIRVVRILVANEGEEFLVYFPEWSDLYRQMKQQYQLLLDEIEANWQQHKAISVQKDFALAIKNLPYQGILFALRSGKIKTIKESLQDDPVHKMIESILTKDPAIKTQIKAILDRDSDRRKPVED